MADELLLTLDRGHSTLDVMRRGPGVVERRRLSPDAPAGLSSWLTRLASR